MLQRKQLLIYLLMLILAFPVLASNNTELTKGNDSVMNGLTQDESKLYKMINDMRLKNKLSSIPLSKDLCIVAQTHIADLIKWKPQDKGCSLHSWSGSGKWTSCCNIKEGSGIQCMKSKPREITGYIGDGYELIFWVDETATAAEAAALWRDTEASSDMILSRAKWSNYNWKAMGIGIKGGYAVLWLGDTIGNKTIDNTTTNVPVTKQPIEQDNSASKPQVTEKKTTKNEPAVNQNGAAVGSGITSVSVNGSGTNFYLIVSSFKTSGAADSDLKKIRINGYPDAFILEGESYFRIALASYESYEKATALKNELKKKFPGIWVYKK